MSDATKVVVGLKRYGKSTHVVTMTRACRRIVFYDTLNDDYAEGIVCRDWQEFCRLWKQSHVLDDFRLTYKPEYMTQHFNQFCTMAYACEDLAVVIDEIHLFFRGSFCDPPLEKLITAGGHPKVEIIGVTQNPKSLGKILHAQATVWDVFAVRNDEDVKWLSRRCSGVSADLIKTLPKYEYLHFVDGEPHYWRCKDDPETGRTWKEVVEYEGQAVTIAKESNLSDDAALGGPVERESANGAAGLPGSQGAGD